MHLKVPFYESIERTGILYTLFKREGSGAISFLVVTNMYIQGRIQDLAQGGDKSGAKRPKNFLFHFYQNY